jgi:hypothetical protein
MFAIELRSFSCIAPKTWETLADVRYRAQVLWFYSEHQLRSPMFRSNTTKGPKLYSEHQLRSPMI